MACSCHVSGALSRKFDLHSSGSSAGCSGAIVSPGSTLPAPSRRSAAALPRSGSKSRKMELVPVPIRAVTGAESSIVQEDEGEPISLGTAKLPANLDVNLLQDLLFQWANGLTQNANFTLELPLKVDKLKNGVRLAYVRINEGIVEDLVYIDVLILPPESSNSTQPLFQAQRSGKLKNSVPPGEPAIMQSLLQALKKSVAIATKE